MEKKEAVLLEKKDNVYYLTLNHPKANNFSNSFIRKIHEKLDIVEKDEDACALVTNSSLDKFFSTGLDLKFVQSLQSVDDFLSFIGEFSRLLGRILVFPCPTIAVINGYCIAGGFCLALSHDFRFMAPDKTFVCLNEVDMGTKLPPAMNAVARCKLYPDVYRDVVLLGKKINAKEALERKIVEFVVDRKDMDAKVHEFASKISDKGRFKQNFQGLKRQLYEREFHECFNKGFNPDELDSVKNFLQFASKL